jgi:hypothetical protein
MRQVYSFVGGPQDGQAMDVPEPVFPGMELQVLMPEPGKPSASYLFRGDGRFYFCMSGDSAAREAAGDSSTRAS